ncbi:MAG TPA: amidohydrolase [Thermomonospora sp.]|nr:amidohydrolase [Thermomonospora sp.]
MNEHPAQNGTVAPDGDTGRREHADLIVRGRILTLDAFRPRARALAVRAGRIVAIGEPDDVADLRGPRTHVIDAGDGCVLPGFVEAHGHFIGDGLMHAGALVDIRPVRIPDAGQVIEVIRRTVAERGETGAYFNGWDPLLQRGLPAPTLSWLDGIAPETPLIILHDSGHSAYVNSVAMRRAGLSRYTPDPPGGHLGRTPDGELDGSAHGPSAVARVMAHLSGLVTAPLFTEALAAESGRVNAAGVTTMSEMGFNPVHRPWLDGAREAGALSVRLRLYEVATPALSSQVTPGRGDDLLRQVGVKVWADGSAWVGKMAASFPYLDTPATRMIGLPPGHRALANYTHDELDEIFQAYHDAGWQLACHANGDVAVDLVLDVWEELLEGRPPVAGPPMLRLEHVSAMRPDQFERAHALGVTCSLFPDHVYYWGEVIADDLFGIEVAERWAPVHSALLSGMRVSLHNDSPVTPVEPLRNIAVAATRMTRGGRLLGGYERIGVDQALRAQTIDAAWQLHADDVTGSLEPGKYADLAVLSADPHEVAPAEIADLEVRATFLAGRQVHGDPL